MEQVAKGSLLVRVGAAPVTWRCTSYVALHPFRTGAMPTDRVHRPHQQAQPRIRTPPHGQALHHWAYAHVVEGLFMRLWPRPLIVAGIGVVSQGPEEGLAGLRDDAPSEARGADGSRVGRRPRAHRAARPSRACQAARPDKAHAAPGTPVGQHNNTGIQAERPASSVARWTPPRPASWAAWVRHEKPSARYTASGCAARDGSSECDATATDRS